MKILSVSSVVVQRIASTPSTLVIHAQGMAATSGWLNARLDNSADPNPADDVYEFGFEADKPAGIALQVLSPMSVSLEFKPPTAASAIVVSARGNSITVHASEFIEGTTVPGFPGQHATTMAIGEEGVPPWPLPTFRMMGAESLPTTLAFGEEGHRPFPTSPLTDDPAPLPPWDPRLDPYGPFRSIFGRF